MTVFESGGTDLIVSSFTENVLAVRAIQARQNSGIERRLIAGQMLFDQGDATVGVNEVVSGKVRQARVDPEGRDVVVGRAGPGEMIAEASLFSRTHGCAATAVTNAVVRLYRKALLLAQLERFAPTKTVEQQSCLKLHRARHLFIRQQTAVINSIRAYLAKFGIVATTGRRGVEQLLEVVADPADYRLPEVARGCLAALGS